MLSDKNLDFLKQVGRAIATQFGEDCEVVIHKIDEKDMDFIRVTISIHSN